MDFKDLDKLVEGAKESIEKQPELIKESLGNSENTGEASPETCTKAMEELLKTAGDLTKVKPFEVFFGLAFLLQRGATSPKTPGSTKFSYGASTITVDNIRKVCKEQKITVRQLARGLNDKIIDLMLILGDKAPEGNLAKALKLELKNVTVEEAVWASDFQTYNERCPTRIKNWLVKNYRSRFRK